LPLSLLLMDRRATVNRVPRISVSSAGNYKGEHGDQNYYDEEAFKAFNRVQGR